MLKPPGRALVPVPGPARLRAHQMKLRRCGGEAATLRLVETLNSERDGPRGTAWTRRPLALGAHLQGCPRSNPTATTSATDASRASRQGKARHLTPAAAEAPGSPVRLKTARSPARRFQVCTSQPRPALPAYRGPSIHPHARPSQARASAAPERQDDSNTNVARRTFSQ